MYSASWAITACCGSKARRSTRSGVDPPGPRQRLAGHRGGRASEPLALAAGAEEPENSRSDAPQVDAAAGTAGFYVELPNELRAIPAASGGWSGSIGSTAPGSAWKFACRRSYAPVGAEVPIAAVADDGLNHYVFQVSGNTFVRRAVQVLDATKISS